MKKNLVSGIVMAFLLSLSLEAVVPKNWTARSKDDFLKGKFNGVSLSFDGALSLAPREDKIAGPAEEFYLSLLPLSDGSLFLGTGHGGKIYRIDKDGKAELYFQTGEMDVTSLVRDAKGILYAGTSPNGKIYRITGKGKGDEFFNPAEKYVWDLMFLESGNLLAAVGENGGIYEISPQGEGHRLLTTQENHIMCLRRGKNGEIIAGSAGGGMIYRLTRDNRSFVLFESPYEEIRSLVVDKNGVIFACASGTPSRNRKEDAPQVMIPAKSDAAVVVSADASGAASTAETLSRPASGEKEPSALYRIAPDGVAKKLWSSEDELIYSLAWKGEEEALLFGTGSKGRLYSIDRDEKVTLLLQEDSEQVFLLASSENRTIMAANNPPYLGVLREERRSSGEYLSSALDAKMPALWGKIEWTADPGQGGSVQVLTRSGNSSEPNETWSDWSPPYVKAGEQILSPKARFLQIKVQFKAVPAKTSPSLGRIGFFYLQTNIAPAVSRLEMIAANQAFLKLPDQEDAVWGADEKDPASGAKKEDAKSVVLTKRVERQGFQTVVWEASDENGDDLAYDVFIRKEGDKEWRLLQENRREPVYAFDTLSFADGTYFIKVRAVDGPSNPEGQELSAERIGQAFVIDNSTPLIKGFSAAKSSGGAEISFQAEDAFSYIEEVKIQVRPGDWRVVFPTDGICDSRTESFKFTLKIPAGGENQINIRIRDSFGNTGAYKQPL